MSLYVSMQCRWIETYIRAYVAESGMVIKRRTNADGTARIPPGAVPICKNVDKSQRVSRQTAVECTYITLKLLVELE